MHDPMLRASTTAADGSLASTLAADGDQVHVLTSLPLSLLYQANYELMRKFHCHNKATITASSHCQHDQV